MSWLVLASECDEAGRWVAEGLAGAGRERVLFVTDADLADATWAHHVADDSTSTRVELADGRTIDSADVAGTVNRLTHVPPLLVDALVDDDRQYGLQELSALVMSWLASLPAPTLNPPDTRGLSGAWRSPAEWALLAGASGLEAAPVLFDSAAPQPFGWSGWSGGTTPAPLVEDVIVVGATVFADPELTTTAADACRRLAMLSDTPILGIAFADGVTSPVVGVTPLPDVRAGGDAMIDALAEALRAEPVAR
jgi:hypothetical protein